MLLLDHTADTRQLMSSEAVVGSQYDVETIDASYTWHSASLWSGCSQNLQAESSRARRAREEVRRNPASVKKNRVETVPNVAAQALAERVGLHDR